MTVQVTGVGSGTGTGTGTGAFGTQHTDKHTQNRIGAKIKKYQ
jgi:hypothetical protein